LLSEKLATANAELLAANQEIKAGYEGLAKANEQLVLPTSNST
jgi:hypothetical protein